MQWQKKLYEHEELPPEEAWKNIQKEITGEPYLIREKLFSMESEPPANSWELIRDAVEEKTETPVKKLTPVKWRNRVPAYAAAVAVAALVLTALIYLMNNESASIGSADLTASLSKNDSPKQSLSANNDADQSLPGIQKIVPNAAGVSWEDGNYIYISTSQGGYNRLSYKFQEMVKVVYEKDSASKEETGRAEYWNKTMTDWKDKVAASSFIPAGNNFFDLAEMISLLEENP